MTTTTTEQPPAQTGAAPLPAMSTSTAAISHGRDTVQTLVVDTAPLLQSRNISHLASRFITIPEVMREVRDRQARQNLAALPFELEVKIPSEEALAAVVAFSKKTGDYASLSATDLKVLALTWMMEKEARGVAHLRTEPIKPVTQAGGKKAKSGGQQAPVPAQAAAGAEKEEERAEGVEVNGSEEKTAEGDAASEEQTRLEEEANAAWGGEEEDDDEEDKEEGEEEFGEAEGSSEALEEGDSIENEENENGEEPTEAEIQEAQARLASLSTNSLSNDQPNTTAENEDDDDGWITPKNVARHKAKDLYGQGKKKKEPELIPVACITSDFAMQNVLLQMNLRLLSVDGVAITRLKHWILRCHACYKTTKDMEKKFCPHCGNNTLIRTSMGIDSKGNVTLYLKKNFQYNVRGTKFSIPAMKGGRQNNDLILREDQREYQKALASQRRQKSSFDVFDVDYVPLNGKGRKMGGGPTIGYGRRNVNESRKPRRR
ncbi:Nin1 binding protein [Rhizophlyctis rosea]|nr:Nin1 binding protein [Rhizophlyctis rosea]